jgi:hypothetical protein
MFYPQPLGGDVLPELQAARPLLDQVQIVRLDVGAPLPVGRGAAVAVNVACARIWRPCALDDKTDAIRASAPGDDALMMTSSLQ